MNPNAELTLIVHGATGYTGRLIVEHLTRRNAAGGEIKWGMAGRSAEKLASVRDEFGAPRDTPLIVADASDPESIRKLVARTKAVATTVGPYQLYGSELVAACVEAGTDYLDLSGEPIWMRQMIEAHHAKAQATGARILFSCGFDSIPFELGVWFCQSVAIKAFGKPTPAVKGRLRVFKGGISGGSMATGAASMAAMEKNPGYAALMADPFCLTPGFQGPPQPSGMEPQNDPDVGPVFPFMLAMINTKNVHRSNLLMGHSYGRDFVYDEMIVGSPMESAMENLARLKPGDGPTKAQREAGAFDVLFIGTATDGRKVRVAVKGDTDPGYGCTAKMIVETALCLVAAPNVDLNSELIASKEASISYSASAALIKVDEKLQKSLIDALQ